MQTFQHCNHCGQRMMVYARSIRPDMVEALRAFYEHGQPAKVSDFEFSRGVNADFTKLRYWDLIERAGGECWKVTRKGVEFLEGRLPVEKVKFIYNNKPIENLEGVQRCDKYKLVFVYQITGEKITKESVLDNAKTMRRFNSDNEALLY